jgi:hypothetical protein
MKIKKGRFPWYGDSPLSLLALAWEIGARAAALFGLSQDNDDQDQNHEQNTQSNRHVEESLFNAPARRIDAARIATGQVTQTNAFALQNNAGDQSN